MSGKLKIALADPISRNGELTAVGNRFIRILFGHAREGQVHDDYTVVMNGGDLPAVNTREALQKEVDKFANTPMRLKFAETIYDMPDGGCLPDKLLRTAADLAKARKNGRQIMLFVNVTSNLPFTPQDMKLVERLLPCRATVVRGTGVDEYMSVEICMDGERMTQDPWVLARKLRPKIESVIV